jgi:hypothetical protein
MVSPSLPIPTPQLIHPPFPEHPLQHRAQTIHLHQTRSLPSTRHPTYSLPPGPNLRLPNLLLTDSGLLLRPREIRAQPIQKRKSLRAHRVLPLRTPVFPGATERTARSIRRCTDQREPARTVGQETAPHRHARKPLLRRSDSFRSQRTQSLGAQRRKQQFGHEQRGLHAGNTCLAGTKFLCEYAFGAG